MPAPLAIPKVFPTDPIMLKHDLQRFAQELDKYLRDLTGQVESIPVLSELNPTGLAFGQIARVGIGDGDQLILKLPTADPKNIGKKCGVRRSSTTGEIRIYPIGCLVGGAEFYRMANDIHYVEFLFDGDYYPSRAGA